MKKTVYWLLILGSFFSATRCLAEAGGMTTVTRQQISQLEEMHKQAANYLLVDDFPSAIRAYTDILLMEPDDETAYTSLGGIYLIQGQNKKAREALAQGKGMGFTGIDDPYEAPTEPELVLKNDNKLTREEAAALVLNYLESKGFLGAPR